MAFSNDCAHLSFYKQSLKGRVQDFNISFRNMETNLSTIVSFTNDLFHRLIHETFKDKRVSARLVAKINFTHLFGDESKERSYHFASYKREEVDDNDEEFFKRHMLKIASRLDSFNHHGSNLIISNIEHIHILITIL